MYKRNKTLESEVMSSNTNTNKWDKSLKTEVENEISNAIKNRRQRGYKMKTQNKPKKMLNFNFVFTFAFPGRPTEEISG